MEKEIIEQEDQTSFEFRRLVPNMFTMGALCCGLISIKMSISGQFIYAAIYIMMAAVLDAVDGNVARKLNVSSPLGAQLDSLADFLDFGVAPGILVYFWKMNEFSTNELISWIPVLIFAMSMAFRLARFNVDLSIKDHNSPLVKYFFTGIPAPMDALLVMLPFAIYKEFDISITPFYVILNTLIVAFFTASTIPTFTPKKLKIPTKYKHLVLLLLAFILVGIFAKLWLTLIIVLVSYIISIVAGWGLYYKFSKELKQVNK